MTENAVSQPGQQIKAILNQDDAHELVELCYGLPVKSITELSAYYDRNFHVLCEDKSVTDNPYVPTVAKDGYVLKVINSLDSKKTEFIEAQNELLLFLDRKGIICTVPVLQKDGSYYSMKRINNRDENYAVRLLTYRKGKVLKEVPTSVELLKNIGFFAASLDNILKEFSHPAYEVQATLWVLSALPKVRDFLSALKDENEINIVEQVVSNFEQKVLSIVDDLEKGIIHGDLNEFNVIVSSNNKNVEAIIDFGDSHKNCFVFELAICVSHMIGLTNNIQMAKYVIEGYQEVRKLTLQEKRILKLCVCARITQSLVLGTYTFQQEPENFYLVGEHPIKWQLLKKLWPIDDDEIMKIWGIYN